MTDLNPHARQMADESMVRNLDAQARAIWPQEAELIRRYGLPDDIRILDAGCGTGEAAWRLAELFPRAEVLGVDIMDSHLDHARTRHARLSPRLRFEHQSIFELTAPDGAFDLTVCRHVVHSIPYPDRVFAELARVTRRGGRLHLIPEDYGMLHFARRALDPRDFWHEAPAKFGAATGTDLFIGRHAYGILAGLGVTDITVDYVVVDTVRVPRDPGSVARRLRGIGERVHAHDAGAGDRLLRPDDRQHPGPPRLRGLDGSGGERAGPVSARRTLGPRSIPPSKTPTKVRRVPGR